MIISSTNKIPLFRASAALFGLKTFLGVPKTILGVPKFILGVPKMVKFGYNQVGEMPFLLIRQAKTSAVNYAKQNQIHLYNKREGN